MYHAVQNGLIEAYQTVVDECIFTGTAMLVNIQIEIIFKNKKTENMHKSGNYRGNY